MRSSPHKAFQFSSVLSRPTIDLLIDCGDLVGVGCSDDFTVYSTHAQSRAVTVVYFMSQHHLYQLMYTWMPQSVRYWQLVHYSFCQYNQFTTSWKSVISSGRHSSQSMF